MKTKFKTVKKYEQEYYHILKPKGNPYFILLTILFGFLSFFNFKIIISTFKLAGLTNSLEGIFNESIKGIYQLIVLYPMVAGYIFVALTIIFFVGIFKKLKVLGDKGLIFGLIIGLIFGLIIGLLLGLIIGLISGLINGLIIGLIVGILSGLAGEFD